ncbi:MAG: DEAD/DEAH box helicase [Armatimonadetes bacterium]|nr:DEAD/DEAH box helicase [Armatimonadota bacterium]
MNRLRATLQRLGAGLLAEWLGHPTIELLEKLDLRNVNAMSLADLVLRQIGPQRLLLDQRFRIPLLEALRVEEARTLCNNLGYEQIDNPYDVLRARRFAAGQHATDVLFMFFGMPGPELAGGEDEPSSAAHPSYPLFSFQRRACRQVLDYLLNSASPRVMLHMPTGSGKTRTAMAVICSLLRNTLPEDGLVVWLAHSEELCDQAAEEFTRAWSALGDRDLPVFRNYGSYRCQLDQAQGGVLVAGLQLLYRQSLDKQDQFAALARRTRLVVMDEAHQAIAPSYRHLLGLLTMNDLTPIIGLSATPGRSWMDRDENVELANFFRHQKVSIQTKPGESPIEFLQKEGYLAYIQYETIPYAPGNDVELTKTEVEDLKRGFDLPERVIRRLAVDHTRNLLLIERILREACDPQAKIIVFACSVEHAWLIANILRLKGVEVEAISSETPRDERQRTIRRFRSDGELQVITNYGVLTTGFDAPKANVAVIARPTRSVVLYGQMVGRVARGPRAGGNEHARVITVVDQIPGFRHLAEAVQFWDDIWDAEN